MVVCRRHVQRLKCDERAMSAVWPCEETVQKAALLSGVAVACVLCGTKVERPS